jgi:hypothetical protein
MELTNKLGRAPVGDPRKQWLCTNAHGASHVISDAQYQKMLKQAEKYKPAREQLATYKIVPFNPETKVADDGTLVEPKATPDTTPDTAPDAKAPKGSKPPKTEE